ncbi:site-specific integrase [Pelosinus sp. sgz500959]|uniref:site-specific integrase n=1 Tax=Pelosinus sp. sgz500959 TaxID=3242472 RepID=UPI00366C6935
MSDIIVKKECEVDFSTEKAKKYILHAKADNTIKSYKADWKDFVSYCRERDVAYLAADVNTVINYVAEMADTKKVSTIVRRLSSISQAHQAADCGSPTFSFGVKAVIKGIKKTKGTLPNKKKAAVIEDIRMMVDTLGGSLTDIRDRALILIGFAGAFRRSELVAITINDLEFTRDGLTIMLKHSKTDQEGQGYKKGIPYGSNPETCPVRSLQDWLNQSKISEGAIFRSVNKSGRVGKKGLCDNTVAVIVKKLVKAAGLDERKYSGHSLRSGLITTAANRGVDERSIMKQSGHKSLTVMRSYIQDATLFKNNAATNVGL